MSLQEVGHVLGLIHEHQRPDRDQFVRIVPANFQPGAGIAAQFAMRTADTRVAYDLSSIMGYPSTAFSANGQPTIVPLRGAITRGTTPTQLDYQAVRVAYGCAAPGATASPTAPVASPAVPVSVPAPTGPPTVTPSPSPRPSSPATSTSTSISTPTSLVLPESGAVTLQNLPIQDLLQSGGESVPANLQEVVQMLSQLIAKEQRS